MKARGNPAPATLRNGQILLRGQLVTSFPEIRNDCRFCFGNKGWRYPALTTVKQLVHGLKVRQMIDLKSDRNGLLVTICNYEKWNPLQKPSPTVSKSDDRPNELRLTIPYEEGKEVPTALETENSTPSDVPAYKGGSLSGRRKELLNLNGDDPVNRWLRAFMGYRPGAGHPLGNLSDTEAADVRLQVADLIDGHGEEKALELLKQAFRVKGERPTTAKQGVLKCKLLAEAVAATHAVEAPKPWVRPIA